MKFAAPDTSKHRPVRRAVSSGFLELCDVSDILELRFCDLGIVAVAPSKSAEHVTCFIFAADFNEPLRRLRENPGHGE
jgi:hypothetical protein